MSIQQIFDTENNDTANDLNDLETHIANITMNALHLTEKHDDDDKITATETMNDIPIKLELDTGTKLSTLPFKNLDKTFCNHKNFKQQHQVSNTA